MLPPNVYFDTDVFQKELELLFRGGPGYVGHVGTVPHIGDFSTLKQERDGRVLVRNHHGVELISNICRHRQAIMLQGRGASSHITCPLHKWSWNLEGKMAGAPFFRENPCIHLKKWPLQNWRGLLFSGVRNVADDLKDVGFEEEIDFDHYRYHHSEYHSCHYNWKSFMEVYGDDYHIAPYHPGLSKMVSLKHLKVTTGEHWHIQTIGATEILDGKTTPFYELWRQKCLEHGNGKLPKYGAVWLAYYPNIMVEIYPYTMTISTLHPISPTETMNVVEFFYHEDASEALIDAERAAYMETAHEDDDIAERRIQGGVFSMRIRSTGTSQMMRCIDLVILI